MIPFKSLRTLDNFAVIEPPTNAKCMFFQGCLLLFLPFSINIEWKIRKLLFSKARSGMCPHFTLIKDQFRGIEAKLNDTAKAMANSPHSVPLA